MLEGYIIARDRRYVVNSKGHIFSEGSRPSGEWICTGAVRFNNFGHAVERCDFADLPRLAGLWCYRNGKQRWHIVDNDHGTKRVWMNPTHRGFFSA
jgi:hypothetical protein